MFFCLTPDKLQFLLLCHPPPLLSLSTLSIHHFLIMADLYLGFDLSTQQLKGTDYPRFKLPHHSFRKLTLRTPLQVLQ